MSDDDNEDWIIEDDDSAATAQTELSAPPEFRPWRILVIDDEADIHAATRLALNNFQFKQRGLEILSAYSAHEAYQLLQSTPDINLILLDVVMESDDAGLQLVHKIRSDLNNHLVRIVLRTGQPGQAPERRVIVDYDINDYKTKTELTTQRLFTTVVASLRAYEGLLSIERSRQGLARILQASSNLYELKSLREFASGVLNQIGAVLEVGADGVICLSRGLNNAADNENDPSYTIIAATGVFSELDEQVLLPQDSPWLNLVSHAFAEKRNQFSQTGDAFYIHTRQGHEFTILLTPPWPLGQVQKDLLELFCDRIAAAYDNRYLNEQLQRAQEASVIALTDLAESRDTDTGGHVQRVARLTAEIARRLKLSGHYDIDITQEFLDLVGIASILHDVGKVATPDAVLLKAGLHNADERKIMEYHALAGELVLQRAAAMVDGVSYLTYGAQIAGGHHEHFDGNGYPRQLSGEQIPLAARIVAAVDVFDALLHKRPYKEAWPLDKVLSYMREKSGKQFDPHVVAVLLDFIEQEQPAWLLQAD